VVGRKIVIDVSDKLFLEGVELHEDFKFVGVSLDLVMICYVLEYLNDLVIFLMEVC